jgi:hypothetical protein
MGIWLAPSGGLHQAGACTKRRLAPSGGLTLKFRKLNVCGGYDLLGFHKKKGRSGIQDCPGSASILCFITSATRDSRFQAF